MGIFSKIVGTVTSTAATGAQALDPVTSIGNVVNTVLERVLPDKAQQAEAKLELAKMQLSGDLSAVAGQLEINKVEASSTNWFIAGWRPSVGWVCTFGLFYQFLLQPIGTWVAALCHHPIVAPTLNVEQLMALLFPLLGLSTQRTIEKIKGVDTQ
jgi:hypothetical protein